MAQTVTISPKETERVAALAYEGETMKVMLCSVGLTGYTASSTVANWQSVEKSGNGYVRASLVVGTGSYDTGDGRYEMPTLTAEFTATGAGYDYDRVVAYVDGATYPYLIVAEDPNLVLSAGQYQTYTIDPNVKP